jgi:predicted Zn finger-like uncharacterized protein
LRIRCERCSTLYELDEALLAPTGSQVQCTKCQEVFTAFPSQGPGRTPVGAPVEPEAAPALPREERTAPPPPEQRAPTAPSGARADPRAPRGGPPPVYRPPSSFGGTVPAGVGRTPVLRRDAVGSFEARLRWSARWRWLAPTLVGLVVAGAAAAWFLLGHDRQPDPRERAEALALVARDDAASLDEAIARLDEAVGRPAARRGAVADRALAQVIRAAVVVEDGEALAARRAALLSERERLLREQPEGWEDAERAAADGARALDSQARVLEEQARVLGASAFEALRVLQAEVGDAPDVLRGVAAYHAIGGDRVRAETAIRTARDRAASDPWLDLVEGWVGAGAADPSVRERALAQLGTLATAHPGLLRGRYLLARAQASLGRRTDALATLERLLADNPRHAGATRLRDDLAATPEPTRVEEAAPPAADARPVSPEARPAGKPLAAPRKIVSRPPPGSPPAGDGSVPAEAPPPVEAVPIPGPEQVEIPAPPPLEAPTGPADTAASPAPRPRRSPIRDAEQDPPANGG